MSGPGGPSISDTFTPPRGARLREAHAHVAALGQSLEMVSLAGCRSLGECLEAVGRLARGAGGGGGWVRLHSARPMGWPEGRWPTRGEIDRAAPGACVVVMSFDHHSACASTAALSAAGLRPGTALPTGGTVEADEHGEATGVLLEQAAHAAWSAAPEPTMAERRGQVRAGLAELARLGFVEVHDLLSQEWLGPMLGEMERTGELLMPVWLYPPAERLAADHAGMGGWASARVRLAGGKVFADGTLNSRTACMLHRYAEPLVNRPRGQCMCAPAALDGHYRLAEGLGLPLAVHAIGDGAVRTVLDSIERVRPRVGGQRIEHCEVIDGADVGRFAKMGVVCSVQPCHLLTDVEALERFVPHRLGRVLPLRELIDAGCRPGELLWFGSDAPIVRANPEDSVSAAVLRRRAGAPPGAVIGPGQAISEAEAWGCFGVGGGA